MRGREDFLLSGLVFAHELVYESLWWICNKPFLEKKKIQFNMFHLDMLYLIGCNWNCTNIITPYYMRWVKCTSNLSRKRLNPYHITNCIGQSSIFDFSSRASNRLLLRAPHNHIFTKKKALSVSWFSFINVNSPNWILISSQRKSRRCLKHDIMWILEYVFWL